MTSKKEALNKLALRGEFMPQQAWLQIEALTAKLQSSGALPNSIKNGSQLAMVFLAGYEAGMTPMESINSFYIVNGKVTIWGSAVLVQLRRAGFKLKWLESTDKIASVRITSPDDETHEETYTIEEAKASGLLGKDTWTKYPKEMLRHKAIGRGVRFFCPEVLAGFYLKEEIEDENEVARPTVSVDANVIDVEQKPKLDEKLNDIIHAAWRELAALEGWDSKKAEGVRHKTLLKNYGVTSNNDLTDDQAKDFIKRIDEALEKKRSEAKADDSGDTPEVQDDAHEAEKQEETQEKKQENGMTPEQVAEALGAKLPVKCPTCKKEFDDWDVKTGNAEAVQFAGECNGCLNGTP